jgi:hypothetical protein
VFRDDKRCAQTIKSIFDNAKNPKRIHIGNYLPRIAACMLPKVNSDGFRCAGLVQQIHTEEDAEGGCLHHYCTLSGNDVVHSYSNVFIFQ